MNLTENDVKPSARYRVCNGKFFVNGAPVPVNRRILRIGLQVAGMDGDEPCGSLKEEDARLILRLERSYLLAGLAEELRQATPEWAA